MATTDQPSQAKATALPQASRKLLDRCVDGLLADADLSAPVSKWLKSLAGGRTQRELARAVFRFLNLLREESDGTEYLISEVALWRTNEELFATEFIQRVRQGYLDAGCKHAEHIGAPFHDEETLRLVLESEPPFQRENKGTRDNLVRTALHFHTLFRQRFSQDPEEVSEEPIASQPAPGKLVANGQNFRQQGTILSFDFRLQQSRSAQGGAVTATVHIDCPNDATTAQANRVAWLEALAARVLDEADRIENGDANSKF